MAAAITFDADHTITVVEFTEGTPCTFEDIYDADVAGGWGIVTKAATKTYAIAGSLTVGDGSNACYLTDTNCNVTFSYAWLANEKALWMRTGSVTQMGILSNGLGSQGCSFMFKSLGTVEFWVGNNGENGDFLFYGGYMSARDTTGFEGRLTSRPGPTWDFTDSIIAGFRRSLLYIGPVMTRTVFQNFNNKFYSNLTATDVTSLNGGLDIDVGNHNVTINITNFVALPNPGRIAWGNRGGGLYHLINPDSIAYVVSWGTDTDPANNVNYNFTLNLNVIDVNGDAIEGATVTIKDSSGNNVAVLDSTATANVSPFTDVLASVATTDGTQFAENDVVKFDGEFALVTGVAGNTISVTRGYYGAGYGATYHDAVVPIYKVVDSLTTDASGDITEQIILYRQHRNDDGSITTTDFDPHTVTVTKAGYASKTVKYKMDQKRTDILLLSPENSTAIYDSTIYDSTIY